MCRTTILARLYNLMNLTGHWAKSWHSASSLTIGGSLYIIIGSVHISRKLPKVTLCYNTVRPRHERNFLLTTTPRSFPKLKALPSVVSRFILWLQFFLAYHEVLQKGHHKEVIVKLITKFKNSNIMTTLSNFLDAFSFPRATINMH